MIVALRGRLEVRDALVGAGGERRSSPSRDSASASVSGTILNAPALRQPPEKLERKKTKKGSSALEPCPLLRAAALLVSF